MTPSRVLHALAGAPLPEGKWETVGLASCAICACTAPVVRKYAAWAGPDYTDHNKIMNPGSPWVCPACVWAHSWVEPPGYVRPAGKPPVGPKGVHLRMFSHLWREDTGYIYTDKSGKALIRSWLRAEKPGAWFAAIADSGKRHVLPWTPMVQPRGQARVCFDGLAIKIGDWRLVDAITDLLNARVTKDEIASRAYCLRTGEQIDMARAFESAWGSLRNSGWFDLALWLSQRATEVTA